MDNVFTEQISSILLSLIIVVGVIVLMASLLKLFTNIQFNNDVEKPMKMVSVLSFGGKEKLALIEVSNQKILVSVSSAGIQKVHVLPFGNDNDNDKDIDNNKGSGKENDKFEITRNDEAAFRLKIKDIVMKGGFR